MSTSSVSRRVPRKSRRNDRLTALRAVCEQQRRVIEMVRAHSRPVRYVVERAEGAPA